MRENLMCGNANGESYLCGNYGIGYQVRKNRFSENRFSENRASENRASENRFSANGEGAQKALNELCRKAKGLVRECRYGEAERIAREAMMDYPGSAQPHNLYGIAMEQKGEHAAAMRHFRAAYALDPSFAPARKNMETYGGFCLNQSPAYTMDDCMEEEKRDRFKIQYDERGIGRLVRRGVHDFF